MGGCVGWGTPGVVGCLEETHCCGWVGGLGWVLGVVVLVWWSVCGWGLGWVDLGEFANGFAGGSLCDLCLIVLREIVVFSVVDR